MTAPARAFLASRVARRVFLLFVLSALVPLALMVLLSVTQVRGVLIEQGEQRLARDAKSYASAAFDRLLDAADVARLAVQAARYRHSDAVTLQPFDTLARVTPDGEVKLLAGEAIAFEPTAKERRRLDAGFRVMRIVTSADDTRRIVVVVPLLDAEMGGWALAGIRDRWLWGHPDEWPTTVQFCVLDGGTLAPIFCPDKQPLDGVERVVPERIVAPSSFTWEADGTRMRSVPWGQFLGAEFGTDDWVVLASQPESELLKSAFAFRGVLLPAAVLALLAVIWLSLRMIRWTLIPLERLTDATRRLAFRDFASRVPVEREDEFGELAVAFNAMARQLGSQFQALKTLAAIDREILSSHDMDRVMRAVLHHAAALVGAQATALVLLDENDRGNSRIGVLHGTGELATRPVVVGEDSRASVLSQPDGGWLTAGSPAAQWSEGVFDPAMGALYVYPIVWRDALCGMLAFGFATRLDFGDDERLQIRELAARMAVAVSSAWRDAQLYAQAHFDALTGLPNRLLFADRLCQHIVRCEREGSQFTLLFVDLDHFKYVNDTQGHSCGDLVLAESARRLARCVRATDTVARLGGDEFAIALATHDSPGDVDRVVRQVLSTLAKPFVVDGQRSFLGASIGVAVFPGDGKTAEDLLRNADTAMYRAKSNGRGQAVFYEERMNREAQERVSLDRELRVALERDELELHYQPQLELRTGRISGAEALLRWRHPEHGLVLPGRFIPVAEASDLIEDIGRWVIRAVCRQDHAFRRQGILLDRLAANASARELHHTEFVAFVCKTMREFGTRPASLEIEVTESMLVQRVGEVRAVLEDLKAAGVVIALDDFGVGFASMASLRDFPFDIVKIDRSFVAALPGCRHSLAIVTATIAISHALDKRVIAEGVENEEQLRTLRELGCDFAQGYLLGRPMPAEAFAAFVREHGARRAQGHERALTLVIGQASTSPDAPAMAASAAP